MTASTASVVRALATIETCHDAGIDANRNHDGIDARSPNIISGVCHSADRFGHYGDSALNSPFSDGSQQRPIQFPVCNSLKRS
jgi:hypothetical protein